MKPMDVVEAFCKDADLAYKREESGRLGLQLKGEKKLTIGIMVTQTENEMLFESFFMRKPMENQDEFYSLLLHRNFRSRGVAFALDAIGDVYLVARLPVASVTEPELDGLVGAFLVESDGMFEAAMRIGFAGYLEADMAWRAKQLGS
jgi:hypothetical protein